MIRFILMCDMTLIRQHRRESDKHYFVLKARTSPESPRVGAEAAADRFSPLMKGGAAWSHTHSLTHEVAAAGQMRSPAE